MLLILDCFLNLGGKKISCLFLLNSVDLSECSTSKFLNNFVSFVKNFLALFQHYNAIIIIINLKKLFFI